MNTEASIFNALSGNTATAKKWPQARVGSVPATPFFMITFGDGSVTYLNGAGEVVPRLQVAKNFWLDVMGRPEVINHYLGLHKDLWPEVLSKAVAESTAKDTFAALLWAEVSKSTERFT